MNKELGLLVFFYCLCKVDKITATCHCTWMEGPAYCYWFSEEYNDKRNWDGSNTECERRSSTLGIVYSSAEREWLKVQMMTKQFHWMGYIQTSAEEFRYIVTNRTDTFILDFAPVKGSKEVTRKDCAGIEPQSDGSDIWWRDKKCSDKKFFVCIKPKAVDSATNDSQTTVTTLQTETQKRTTARISRYQGDLKKRKAKQLRTAPISREPVHVVAGTSAIIILVSVVAFIIGSDVSSLLCKMKLCDQEKKRPPKNTTSKRRSYIFRYNYQIEGAEHGVNLWIELQNYKNVVEINNKKTEFDTKAFKKAYVVQTGNSLEVWINHMSINLSQINEMESIDNNEHVDGKPDNEFNILRIINQAPAMPNSNYTLINTVSECDRQQNQTHFDCDKTVKICKPVDIPIVATYVDPESKVAVKATYTGSRVHKQNSLCSNDTNVIRYIRTRNRVIHDSQMTVPQHGDSLFGMSHAHLEECQNS